MIPIEKQKAEELITSYKIILMNEDTECGNEILCTSIAIKCSLIYVNDRIQEYEEAEESYAPTRLERITLKLKLNFWNNVKSYIEKY